MNQNRAIAVGVDLGTSGVRVPALGELGNIVGIVLHGGLQNARRVRCRFGVDQRPFNHDPEIKVFA